MTNEEYRLIINKILEKLDNNELDFVYSIVENMEEEGE